MPSLDTESLTPLHWVGIVAALVTAGVHLFLALDIGGTFGALFTVASAGFIGAVVLLLLGWQRRLLYLLGIPFTGGQIVWWYAANQPSIPPPTIELVDKVAQVLLIVVLAILYYRESQDADGLF